MAIVMVGLSNQEPTQTFEYEGKTFVFNVGATYCLECGSGFVAPDEGTAMCLPCSPGTYTPATASTSCIPCRSGFFSGSYGARECTPCPLHHFSSGNASVCDVCPAGMHAPQIASSVCKKCPAGSFSEADGNGCKPCPVNTYTEAEGTRVCRVCPAGSYSNKIGADSGSACKPCSRGFFYSVDGGLCMECPRGSYSNVEGAFNCTLCPEGLLLHLSFCFNLGFTLVEPCLDDLVLCGQVHLPTNIQPPAVCPAFHVQLAQCCEMEHALSALPIHTNSNSSAQHAQQALEHWKGQALYLQVHAQQNAQGD